MSENSQKNVTINISIASILRVIGFFLLLWFLYIIKDILVAIFVAMLLATALGPIVGSMQKRGIPRPLAVVVIYLVLLSVLGGIVALLIPPLTEQIQQAAKNFPMLWERFIQLFSSENVRVYSERLEVKESIGNALESLQSMFGQSASSVYSFASTIFGNIVSVILVFVLTFYFIIEEGAIKKGFRAFTPPKYQPYLNDLITRMQDRIGRWLRGMMILVLIVGGMTLVGLRILDVKYFLLLAIIAGMFELIPYLGPILAAIPAAFIAFADSPMKGLAVIILYWLIQQTENHFIVPKVMQRVIGLNPIVVIIVILIGARLAGFVGIVVAVPTAAALSVIIKDVFEKGDFGSAIANEEE